MERLTAVLGRELDIDDSARRLYRFARDTRAPIVGAMLVTCADESERECADAFRHQFSEHLLPHLKFGERSHFRIANLGGRYEWGAAAIAEQHYAGAAAGAPFKLVLVKVNAHVSVDGTGGGVRYGQMARYAGESVYCGALDALLTGSSAPFADDLAEAFASEEVDRLACLCDQERVDPSVGSLFAALASARLQARRALVDIQDRRPLTPTVFVVLPSVTLNRRTRDGELLCGVYRADWTGDAAEITYQGLGDDPAAYQFERGTGRVAVSDPGIDVVRPARDHRALALTQWAETAGPAAPAATADDAEAHARLDELVREGASRKHDKLEYASPMLAGLLNVVSMIDPVLGATVMFAQGVAGIHHLFRIHRISRNLGDDGDAHRVLDEAQANLDRLPPERARQVVDVLLEQLRHRRRG